MGITQIDWADRVWNPVTGCTKVSAGCAHCYAERMSKRLRGRCGYPADDPFKVTLHAERLEEPLHWRKPSRVFVCSMGDLFHEDVPDEFICNVFHVISMATEHIFLILTKRPERLLEYIEGSQVGAFLFFDNVWFGVSVEDQATADERIPLLLQTPAEKRFVSYEPALGPVDFKQATHRDIAKRQRERSITYLKAVRLDWLIMGGESGPGARPMHPDWARSARDQCQAAGVPFFFKQWGEWAPNCRCDTKRPHKTTSRTQGKMGCMFRCGKKAAGHILDGHEYREVPE